MVDTLVSGASASRRVGSTPIIRTQKRDWQSVISQSLFYIVPQQNLTVGHKIGLKSGHITEFSGAG